MTIRAIAAATLLLCSACMYDGAVYSQYTEVSLASVAVRPEEASPVDINMGWERGSVSYVPKLETREPNGTTTSGATGNEAAALIALEKTAVRAIPGTDGTLLRADGTFLSGNAAIVAAQPYGTGTAWSVNDKTGKHSLYSGRLKGSAAQRIQEAMQAGAFNCPGEAAVAHEHELIQKRSDASDVYARAEEKLPKAFRDEFAAAKAKGASERDAFKVASMKVTADEEPCGEQRMAILEALQNANRE